MCVCVSPRVCAGSIRAFCVRRNGKRVAGSFMVFSPGAGRGRGAAPLTPLSASLSLPFYGRVMGEGCACACTRRASRVLSTPVVWPWACLPGEKKKEVVLSPLSQSVRPPSAPAHAHPVLAPRAPVRELAHHTPHTPHATVRGSPALARSRTKAPNFRRPSRFLARPSTTTHHAASRRFTLQAPLLHDLPAAARD